MTSDASKPTRIAEFLGLSFFAAALMLMISLATYNPADPAPFFKAGASGQARNFIGPVGAFLAELFIPQLFGMAALLLPLVLGVTGWKLFWCRPIEAPYTKVFGLTLMLLSLTALLSLSFGSMKIENEPVRSGGAVGELVSGLLTASFNRPGAYIVVATALFVSVILARSSRSRPSCAPPIRPRASAPPAWSPPGRTSARRAARRRCAATS